MNTRWFFAPALAMALFTGLSALPGADASNQGRAGEMRLLPVPQPDISGTEAEVRETLQSVRAGLDAQLRSDKASDQALAAAFGEMGEFYQSHHVYIPAEPCYRNAALLAPQEFRWPYYLGYLMVQTSRPEQAVESFEAALRIRPDYAPARLRLADVLLDLGRLDEAEALFEKVRPVEGVRGPALFGLGRVAMARGDPRAAVSLLEEALELQPGASKIHYSLGMAYRALGAIDAARRHLAEYGEGKPEIEDPVLDKLNELSTGVRPLLFRAIDAVHAGHHEKAVDVFRQALAKDPDNVNARVSLARSLYQIGQVEESRRQLEEALRRAPDHALANFFLGVWLEAAGQTQAAMEHFKATLAREPEHGGAHHFLADIDMRAKDYPEAAAHYARAVKATPEDLPARLMLAMAMLRAGASQSQVRESLEHSLEVYPDEPMFAAALARLLAASPDAAVRDGKRALALAQSLFDQANLLENAEILAMAYAETGRYADAAALQQNAFDAALVARRIGALARLNANLALYRDHKPCREPFPRDDPVFYPQRMDPILVFREYPTREAY